jgi:hypothetical protein
LTYCGSGGSGPLLGLDCRPGILSPAVGYGMSLHIDAGKAVAGQQIQ